MSEKPELKPCPFCGGEAAMGKTRSLLDPSELWHRVWCIVCRAESDEYIAEQDAITAWNRRAE